MKKYSKLLVAAVAAVLLLVCASAGSTPRAQGIAAQCGEYKVYQSWIDRAKYSYEASAASPVWSFVRPEFNEREVIDSYIMDYLVKKEALSLGFGATDAEVAQFVAGQREAYGTYLPYTETVDGYCEYYGITLDEYWKHLEVSGRDQMIRGSYREYLESEWFAGRWGQEYRLFTDALQAYREELLEEHADEIRYY